MSYNTLLSVCAAAEDAAALWEQAERVLDDMRIAQVAPDTLSYGTAMRSMALAGRLQRGWELYERCKAERLVPCTVVLVHALALARRAENWSWVQQASDPS